MNSKSYSKRLFKDKLERGNVGLTACILTYYNITLIMINKGALAEYSQVEILLGAIHADLPRKAVLKLKLDPRDRSTIRYDQH
jgi:hypothetical protein